MAAGDAKVALSAVLTTAYLDVKPTGSEEWAIHNLFHGAEAELYFSDGTNQILIASDTLEGGWLNQTFRVNATYYLRIKNTNAGTKYLGYTGVITKA